MLDSKSFNGRVAAEPAARVYMLLINGMPHLAYLEQMLEKGGGGLPLEPSPRDGY